MCCAQGSVRGDVEEDVQVTVAGAKGGAALHAAVGGVRQTGTTTSGARCWSISSSTYMDLLHVTSCGGQFRRVPTCSHRAWRVFPIEVGLAKDAKLLCSVSSSGQKRATVAYSTSIRFFFSVNICLVATAWKITNSFILRCLLLRVGWLDDCSLVECQGHVLMLGETGRSQTGLQRMSLFSLGALALRLWKRYRWVRDGSFAHRSFRPSWRWFPHESGWYQCRSFMQGHVRPGGGR